MKTRRIGIAVVAFLVACVVATAWGSVVQTQYNLAGLASLGADVEAVRMQTTMRDLFSGFFPTYGGYIVAPSLLVAFAVAAALGWKWPAAASLPARLALFALAGGLAILAGIPLVNWLSPVALLVGASREWDCTVLMAVGGVVAGLLFVGMTHRRALPGRAHGSG